MRADLAVNLITDQNSTDPIIEKQSDELTTTGGLGHITIQHQLVGTNQARVRFNCQSLIDDLELSRYLCQELVKQQGVHTARVNTWCGSLIVDFNCQVLSCQELSQYLDNFSFNRDLHKLPVIEPRTTLLRRIYNFVGPVLFFMEQLLAPTVQVLIGGAALACSVFGAPLMVTRSLLFISMVPIGLRAADSLLVDGKISVDALDGLAATLMFANGKFKEACFMTALISLGEFIRERTSQHCRKMVDDLLSLSGRSAWLVKGKKRICIPVDQIKVGDILVIYP